MHIEVGVVEGAKMALSYGTAIAALGYLAKQVYGAAKEKGWFSLVLRSVITSLAVLMFFEVFPHQAVGVSEVHLILGSTLFLLFGLVPAGIGLTLGLLVQGLFFAPFDLPNYSVNVTTLLVPLFVMSVLAKKLIPENVAYKDLAYSQVLKLSTAYQGGIVAWVAFWALYGQGFSAANIMAIASFGGAYMMVILLEPLIDLAVLAGAKMFSGLKESRLFTSRLYS
uniref:Predicted cobalt transporter CbtC n=1 Tax=uncultured Thiotrichaceae bacterium TaxID=298394 RepID=A0A6S6SJC8_9GAMM|nr:MAG: Predicted cobalt transporter CbtC [uncultured Thiotrichaceae bacterium]